MGSSPLTRGKRPPRRPFSWRNRLIPAHAGKTTPQLRTPHGNRAHPRSRGENAAGRRARTQGLGSSPLTRGKRRHGRSLSPMRGLIPAHAGKTLPEDAARISTQAHPRSRGENGDECGGIFTVPGSSPLTRGKPVKLDTGASRGGLIPAHAGKTPHGPTSGRCSWAHPRSRGENGYSWSTSSTSSGSSPLTRGKHLPGGHASITQGLIPAHAGKTGHVSGWPGIPRAHPRSRGENSPPRS